MKHTFLLIAFVCTFSVYGQSVPRLTKKADEMYDNNRFLDALAFYDKISSLDKKNYYARYRLGNCYLKTLQYEEAERTFYKLGNDDVAANDYRSEALYKYATILKTNNQFQQADSVFEYVIAVTSDEEILRLSSKQKEGCLLAIRQLEKERGFIVTPVDEVNSKYHDFGATLNPQNKQLVFATTRNLSGTQYEGSQFEGVLPELVSFSNKSGKWKNNSNAQRFSQINTEWSEGAGSFTKDGNTFYFSSCTGDAGSDCAIMVTYLQDGKWTKPAALNEYINEKGSANKQPSVTATGDTLFFSSDRSGGYGGSDIWMSLKGSEQESWSPAINMGDAINTAENDITPYYSSAYSCLLFASNGHIGYGGYDLFAAKGESFFEPQIYNLGAPFNSSLDDTYMSMVDSSGFITSNRADRKILNIYSFEVKDEALFLSLLISGESLIDSKIISRFRDVQSLDLFAFRVEDYQGYELFHPEKRVKPKPSLVLGGTATPTEKSYSDTGTLSNIYGSKDSFKRSKLSVDYEHVYFPYGSAELKPVVKKSLADLAAQLATLNWKSVEILAYTDIRGTEDYNLELSQKRGAAIAEYLTELGLAKDKLVVRARGEGALSSRNSWYSRMFSRRAEIIVNGNIPISLQSARPYAVRYESSIATLEQRLKLPKSSLAQWNDFKSDKVAAGEIIRIGELSVVPSIRYFLEEQDLRNDFFVYRVKKGETLTSIARKFGTIEEVLREVNQIGNYPRKGEEIFIYRLK